MEVRIEGMENFCRFILELVNIYISWLSDDIQTLEAL